MKYSILILFLALMLSASSVSAASRLDPRAEQSVSVTAEFNGMNLAFQGVAEPLTTAFEVIEYQDGDNLVLHKRAGRQMFGSVKLKVGVFTQKHQLFKHWRDIEQGRQERGELNLIWLNKAGAESQRLRFVNAWMSGAEIDADGNTVITMQHEGMQFSSR